MRIVDLVRDSKSALTFKPSDPGNKVLEVIEYKSYSSFCRNSTMERIVIKFSLLKLRSTVFKQNKQGTAPGAIFKAQKIAKRHQSVKVFSSKAPQKPKSWTGLALQGNALRFFLPSVANHRKNSRGHFGEKKVSQFRKKTYRGTFCW